MLCGWRCRAALRALRVSGREGAARRLLEGGGVTRRSLQSQVNPSCRWPRPLFDQETGITRRFSSEFKDGELTLWSSSDSVGVRVCVCVCI